MPLNILGKLKSIRGTLVAPKKYLDSHIDEAVEDLIKVIVLLERGYPIYARVDEIIESCGELYKVPHLDVAKGAPGWIADIKKQYKIIFNWKNKDLFLPIDFFYRVPQSGDIIDIGSAGLEDIKVVAPEGDVNVLCRVDSVVLGNNLTILYVGRVEDSLDIEGEV